MLNHCGTVEIKTDRLFLRKFSHNDVHEIHNRWMNDKRVAEYTSWYPHSSIDDTKAFVNHILTLDDNKSYNWVIELDKKVIGTINVCYSDENTEI